MKAILLIAGVLACVAASQIPFSQASEGIITYEVKTNLHRNLPEERQAMKNMIPEFRSHFDKLIFDSDESLYEAVDTEPEETTDNGHGRRMPLRRPQLAVYTNPNELKRVTVREFRRKKYLIEDSLRIRAWKLDAENREIKGYLCKRATFHDTEQQQTIVAWYADKLRPFLGPESFNDLPGAVLQVDINGGERIITATDIAFRLLQRGEMEIPSGRTKVTEAEFRSMVKEEMDRRRTNGGNIIIQK